MNIKILVVGLAASLFILNAAYSSTIEDADLAYKKENYSLAAQLYLKLAEEGDPVAQFKLGKIYWEHSTLLEGEIKNQLSEENVKAWLKKSADKNNDDAQLLLGEFLSQSNAKEAFNLFMKAAVNGNSEAQHLIGEAYSFGTGVDHNIKEGFKWTLLAAENGNILAQRDLTSAFAEGYGTPKDDDQVLYWYEKLAAQDDRGAQLCLATRYDSGISVKRDPMKAIEWYKKAASHPTGEMQFGLLDPNLALGAHYESGDGVTKNISEANKYYKKMKRDLLTRRDKLSEFYDRIAHTGNFPGFDCDVVDSKREAAEEFWIKKLSERGDPGGMRSQAYYLEKTQPSKKKEILKLYEMAAKKGDETAEEALVSIYEKGEVVAKDLAKSEYWNRQVLSHASEKKRIQKGYFYATSEKYRDAEIWLRDAAQNGNAFAQYWLASALMNDEHAYKLEVPDLLKKSAAQGYDYAQILLGVFYLEGSGVIKNEALGVTEIKKAAEQGNSLAQLKVGQYYFTGFVLPKDKEQAYFWWIIAKKSNNEEAAKASEAVEKQLSDDQRRKVQRLATAWIPVVTYFYDVYSTY